MPQAQALVADQQWEFVSTVAEPYPSPIDPFITRSTWVDELPPIMKELVEQQDRWQRTLYSTIFDKVPLDKDTIKGAPFQNFHL